MSHIQGYGGCLQSVQENTIMSQNIERSIRDLREMDTLASGDSPIHAVSAGAKLLVTVVYILTVVSFDKYRLSGLLFMIFYPAVLFAVSGISVSTCFYKLRFVLPLVLAVGIFNPILDRTPAFAIGSFTVTAGMISMLTLMMKGVFRLTASSPQHGPGGGTVLLNAPEGVSRGVLLCAGAGEFIERCTVRCAVVRALCRGAMGEPDTDPGIGSDEVRDDSV